ncbi:AP-3 complex subunit mu-like [Pollicipes pollicipes]|uniref:AP-3 complex subunit mu-like n=1 Tax=Pollicipes pollicipes TaxID=41117 RepID=UPI001884D549|nr:AP-3 complex subunit mu-like [Pollicipes pollicipes]
MLKEIFVTNRKGHVIFREKGLYCNDPSQPSHRLFYNVIRTEPESPPYFCHSGEHFYHVLADGLRWVAVSGRALPALQVVVWLQTLREVVRAICGGATESALCANHVTLRELAAEVMEDGLMMALDTGRLRSLLLSRPRVSLAADLKSPASPGYADPASSAKHTVYVDVVESVDCVMTPDGGLEKCDVTGRLEVRTAGAGCAQVDVALAEDVRLLELGAPVEAHVGPQVHVRRLHPLQFRPPPEASGVSAACGGAGSGTVRHCRQTALVTWTVRELCGQQETTAELRVTDADASGATETLGPFHLSWEVSDHTVSGLRVAGVRLPGVPEAETRRWGRVQVRPQQVGGEGRTVVKQRRDPVLQQHATARQAQ